MRRFILLTILLAMDFSATAQSENQWRLRLMPQVAFVKKNHVQVPGNDGTRFSLNNDFNRKNRAVFSPRIELEYNFKRHNLIVTAALLRNRFEGVSFQDILYNGTFFGSEMNIDANYRFNTYRVGYRYRLVDRLRIKFELGATLLIRDAVISLKSDTRKSSFYNVGVAPLLSYYMEWKTTDRLSLLSYGDAFAVKVGRAEDIFAGAKYQFSSLISAMAGYRLLEGGSDGSRIYTMATFHYLSLGIGFTF